MRLLRAVLLVVVLAAATGATAPAADTWANWTTSRLTRTDGIPQFIVDRRPFYVYGAAFFYERTPREDWLADLTAYKLAGINTIDLYLIWNWHEPTEGVTDFTGTSNERRDLRALFAIVHELGLKAIVRPGPVIRNEWRNGGYPDWLLRKPEYDMPLHDILEGRYPATATFQNAHADAAAAQWLANRTHRSESERWLSAVLRAIEPWSHDVIAVALDDDQGAYIDNDTWPAPHWHSYIGWLRSAVQRTIGPRVPLFINTFQMKVTASAPVWAWGNWYQSDAFAIGDHDIAQLAFSLGLLQTQPGQPVMTSEFQAGWLQGADEVAPRKAAAANTTLALHEMLQFGAHGVINFPFADTLDPAGWEAPWSNWSYAWDAAFALDGSQTQRGEAAAAFGSLLAAHGTELAAMRPHADIAIAWMPSAFDPATMNNERFAAFSAQTIDALQRCRAAARTCRIVDLRYDTVADLLSTPFLVVPQRPSLSSANEKLRAIAGRVRIADSVDAAIAAGAGSSTDGVTDAALLVDSRARHAMLDAINPGLASRSVAAARVHVGSRVVAISPFRMPPQSAIDIWIDERGVAKVVNDGARSVRAAPRPEPTWRAVPHNTALAYAMDVYRDGEGAFVLDSGTARVVIVPMAGARAFYFGPDDANVNRFTTIGAVRDDVERPLPPSSRDYIAAYTHPIEAGTFNRSYACAVLSSGANAALQCEYEAPDLGPGPVRFRKTFTMDPGSATLRVTLRASQPAASISAIVPNARVQWPRDPDVRVEQTLHEGYRLERAIYPADRDEVVTFAL